jgi:hypothetical protein
VLYRETHILLDELAEAIADGTRKVYMESVCTVPLLIIDDFGMRKLPHTAAEDPLEIVMRRSIGCCITVTCSSAARAVGVPRPLLHPKEEASFSRDHLRRHHSDDTTARNRAVMYTGNSDNKTPRA